MTASFWLIWLLSLTVSSMLGAVVVRRSRERGPLILSVLLAIYVVAANILVPRLVTVKLGWSFVLVTGSIIWPFIAQLTDMLNEIYGKRTTLWAAALAYMANFMFVIFVGLAMQTTPIWEAPQEEWFRMFFGMAWRPALASLCSYTAANWADISLFAWMKKRRFAEEEGSVRQYTGLGEIIRFTSMRSITSDALNMVIDNIVFYTIAFYGLMPNSVLLGLIGSSMLAKVILSQIDPPFFWLFRWMTREVKREF